MSILIGFLTAIHVVIAIFLVILVLMQKSKDQGVGAAFGGGMTETMFGAGTTTALVRMTIWCAGIFLAGSLILTVLHSRSGSTGGGSLMEKVIQSEPNAPVSTVPALPSTQSLPPTETPPAPSAETPVPAPAEQQAPPPPAAATEPAK